MRIDYFKRQGDQHFRNGRGAEITIDLVLQARAKLSENKVNGPEDAVVSEMTKLFLQEILHHHDILPGTFHGEGGGTKLLEECEAGISARTRRRSKERDNKVQDHRVNGIRSYRAIALTSVMSKWYASCAILRPEKEKEPESWKKGTCGRH